MSRRRWLVAGVGGLLLLSVLALGWGFSHGDGYYPVQVRGRLLDAAGNPVASACVWATDRGLVHEYQREWEALRLASETENVLVYPLSGGARTRQDGTFDVYVGVPFSVRTGPFGIEWGGDLAPFEGARLLLVERPGLADQLVDCTRGRWTEHGDGEIFATIDMGDVRLR
jgi:hypothetical protein